MTETPNTEGRAALAALMDDYSVEITSKSVKGLEVIKQELQPGSEVFVANLPNETNDALVEMSKALGEAGYKPVPHVVARNIRSMADLEDMIARLAGEAGVKRVLSLGGDRDDPAGEFDQSLQLIKSGVFRKNGIERVSIACYPEGHPRIEESVLRSALTDKLAAAKDQGHDVLLVSQFLFDGRPIVKFAERLREAGIDAPYRVGVAGPSDRSTLIKFAVRSGVGPSLRALRERQDLARNVAAGETPEALLTEAALAQAANASLGICGVHFFTFGSPKKSIDWAKSVRTQTRTDDPGVFSSVRAGGRKLKSLLTGR